MCHTAQEAIQQARAEFCHEMPRMWDVIQKTTDQEFRVEELAVVVSRGSGDSQ